MGRFRFLTLLLVSALLLSISLPQGYGRRIKVMKRYDAGQAFKPSVVPAICDIRKLSELAELKHVLHDSIPVIKRFTGGGTVIVDDGTIFAAIICNKDDVPGVQPYPRSIMSWTSKLYGEVFRGFGNFHLRENDYAFDTRKFGGNAQSITKNQWIHHTSFLWNYDVKNMDYLKLPMRASKYRLARDHVEFLCKMKEYLPSRSIFIERTITSLENHFSVRHVQAETIFDPSESSFSPSTRLLLEKELQEAYSSQTSRQQSLSITQRHRRSWWEVIKAMKTPREKYGDDSGY
ncbi:uncharacterized protein A4U43_C03F16840 [Asparagus officinalis]|uniref:BPL/LPL catalytic domain-containing protein n=1 Tax=Asparagus officinalis TaxID=4686 RepID=A0A5P1FAP0_ASPOF|nr:uncharacterized protein A4U43_C03F16840 [Asparagus officinalis]